MCAAMKQKLGRQQFEVVVQAAANGKVVARETLKVHSLAGSALCDWTLRALGVREAAPEALRAWRN